MAVYRPHTVTCTCGNPIDVNLADSINAKRSPEARARILAGEFHRATCPHCNRTFIVEKPFFYSDRARNCIFKVLPAANAIPGRTPPTASTTPPPSSPTPSNPPETAPSASSSVSTNSAKN